MPSFLPLAKWLLAISLFSATQVFAHDSHALGEILVKKNHAPAFEVIVLGDSGGIEDGNLSAFLLRGVNEPNYVALDAGTLVNGINQSVKRGAFADLALADDNKWGTTGTILRDHVKGYLLSHAHLDHINGMLVASPEDSAKNIYALPSVNNMIGETYFNGIAWANFSDRGIPPLLNKYHVVDLLPGKTTTIANTELKVTAFSLSHPVESSAFVIEQGNDMFVYFGDTGADIVEKQGKLAAIWTYLAQQIKHKTLRGIIIETSFENERPHNLLFGHLTPDLLMAELASLAAKIDGDAPLKDLTVLISHIKYTLAKNVDPRATIKQQLNDANQLGLNIIIPKQGQKLLF
ncbi:MBL fold metallo-hydrolase [Paraglaciecola polaris]|uniref:Probable 3',5'-cyclic-nucleotide phosphodiesterase n=2 Tax=Paraglaciecola polaris TaxID=222814 RepID=K6ZDA4_9ALTE|nr:3',5'-cyclic-nucleotide phosphodiesterase [Paraglaciecola polaris]GAC34086.1 probable 3',5'-cyclic-nucleotide phosphodiesterase [Paraglaciecola polaris LMG 21857]